MCGCTWTMPMSQTCTCARCVRCWNPTSWPSPVGDGRAGRPRRRGPYRACEARGPRGPSTNLVGVARLLVVVPSETDPPARLGDWLREVGLELDERHLGT